MAGKKFSKGKSQVHYIPSEFILGMGIAFGKGAEKHGPYTFQEGIEYTELIDSMMRHILAFSAGEDLDLESGLPHVWHIGCNAAMLEYQRVHNSDIMDDRFKRSNKSLPELINPQKMKTRKKK